MSIKTYPSKREEIYSKCLYEISGIKFTLREVDIMSCILHNRGEKKIATILNISQRTVSTHTRNIMNKIGLNNSREYIIDAAEKSGKLQTIKEYYFHLIIKASFEKHLQNIATVINRSSVFYMHNFNKDLATQEKISVQIIKNYLSIANILCSEDQNQQAQSINYLYVINHQVSKLHNTQNTNTNHIGLIFENGVDKTLLEQDIDYVDFKSSDNFYFSVFTLIDKIVQKPGIQKIIASFNAEYTNFQDSWSGLRAQETIFSDRITLSNKKNKAKKLIFLGFLGVALLLLFLFFPKQQPDIIKINNDLAEFVSTYSADNITIKSETEKNYAVVRKVEQAISNFNNSDVNNYFNGKQLLQSELINCLYVMHALSTNYTYNQHDGAKALKLLKIAESMVHNYVINQGGVQVDFAKLTPTEIYHELKTTPDLPELYAKIIYLLGSVHIYLADFEVASRYYDLSASLGQKLDLFEGYLATRVGQNAIRSFKTHNDMQQGNYKAADQRLLSSINILEALKEDSREYKINYRPNNLHPRTIIPAKDVHNRVFITEYIVKAYLKRIEISQDAKQRQEYANIISNYFIGSDNNAGMLVQLQNTVSKRSAGICNTLGMIMLKFMELDIDMGKLKEVVVSELDLEDGNSLGIIEQIFNLAQSRSRNTDYTKADAYHGLALVYKMIQNTSKENYSLKIKQLEQERDALNMKLNRTTWKSRLQESMY